MAHTLLEKILNGISTNMCQRLVFAEPVEYQGVKIVPVAKLRYGFGLGAGARNEADTGSGGGGAGGAAQPIGYIELKQGQAQFKPIPVPPSLPNLVICSGIASYFLLKGLAKLKK